MTSIFRCFSAIAGVAVASLLVTSESSADSYSRFLSTTCAPEANFFSLQSHGIYNTEDEDILANSNLWTVRSIAETPFVCDLAEDIQISVKGACYNSLAPKKVPCADGKGPKIQELAILANGELVPLNDGPYRHNEFINWLSLHNSGGNRHSVEISLIPSGKQRLPELFILHCREILNPTPRYQPTGKLQRASVDCWSHRIILENNNTP